MFGRRKRERMLVDPGPLSLQAIWRHRVSGVQATIVAKAWRPQRYGYPGAVLECTMVALTDPTVKGSPFTWCEVSDFLGTSLNRHFSVQPVAIDCTPLEVFEDELRRNWDWIKP